MTDKTNITKIKKIQNNKAFIIIIALFLAMIAIYYLVLTPKSKVDIPHNKKIEYVSGLENLDTQSIVLENTQKQLREAQAATRNVEQKLNSLVNEKENGQKDNENLIIKRLNELENKLHTISEKEVQTSANKAQLTEDFSQSAYSPNGYIQQNRMREDKLVLKSSDESLTQTVIKNPDTFVPSGTFVKAIVIGGADASASVIAQQNPKVMLFRIIENGTLPNHKKSHLKDCTALGRATADISSERGSIEIERLSCVFPNNEVVDQKIKAIVFGPDGKVDVRGNVREGGQQYVSRAFTAGALSGLAEGLSQSYTINSVSPEGNVKTVPSGKIFKYGAAKGTGKAMDQLAHYQIKKAEQFHPVIQLSAGTVVDIVFQMGFFLDGKKHEEDSKQNDAQESINKPSLFPEPPHQVAFEGLPLSDKMVARIEQYQKELGVNVSHEKN